MNQCLSLIIVMCLMLVVATACGSSPDSANEIVAKITPSETIFSLESLTDVGFKKGKTFDVEGLTGAITAYLGYWGLNPYDRKDYEARFYPSHADAVEFGTIFADERTGPDAVIKTGETMWEEGAKEARSCNRAAGANSSNCRISKYGDYIIYGNMILICQGRDSATSLEQCALLLEQIVPELAVNKS